MQTSLKIIFTSLFVFIVLGCSGEIMEKEGVLGKEYTNADYQKVISEAMADITIANSIKGDSVTYENNQRVEMGTVIKTEEYRHTLIDVKVDDKTAKFLLYRDQYNFDFNGNVTSEVHKELPPLVFKLVSAQKVSPLSFRAYTEECDGIDQTDDYGYTYDCIKLFNLTSVKKYVDAPPAIRAKPGCMGLPDCKMPVQAISYNEVKWKQGRAVHTVTISYEVAKIVPDLIYFANADGKVSGYMPPVMSMCQRGHIDIEGNDTIVTLCTVLKDYNITEK